jgi:hypothetical protein
VTPEPLVDLHTGEVIEVALTAAEARDLTNKIRQTLAVGHELIVQAFKGSAWSVLGYSSWDAYCAEEFAGARMVRLDREQRREIVAEMRQAGMSTRAIGSAIGVAHTTVADDVTAASVVETTPATPVIGTNGKTYAKPYVRTAPPPVAASPGPKRRPLPDAFFDAAFDLRKAVERIERLVADDRFAHNAEQVAARHRRDLLTARDALDRVLASFPNTGV